MEVEGGAETKSEDNKYKHFVSQVTYEHFKKLMQVMEDIIGEKSSQYSHEMMITYFGISEMNYEEALEEYNQTINKDKVTGGFARLFCGIRLVSDILGSDDMDERPYEQCSRIDLQPKGVFSETGNFKICS